MARDDPAGWFIAGTIGGLFILGIGVKKYFLKKLIENTPTSKARSVAMGFCEIAGSVVARDPLMQSPFKQRPCVYYGVQVQEERRSKRRTYWATVFSEEKSVKFHLKDETGKILVDLAGAEPHFSSDYFKTSYGAPNASVSSFLSSRGVSDKGLFSFAKKMRFIETIIEPGDFLYIMGTATDNPEVAIGSALKNEENILMKKGAGKPFFVSDKPEKEILKGLSLWSTWGIFGGAILFLGSLALLFLRFGML